ncbi:venom allergen 3-like isoform X2 [Chrysoperla carnea]|uniref:venom allergen 3-like isoform X2 n=1 Tax=Chrysoperla carnea TaxID=189513 RepID=UPI001D07E87E|nr:venom allergen 3-like isoform X2 [Chrysoperla carnea]
MKLFVVLFATIALFSMMSCQDDDDDLSDIVNQYACDACDDITCLDTTECGPNPDTCNQYQDYGVLNEDDKQLVLQKQNELRQKVASGSQENQPSATNMYELIWDDKLANMAQCFANNCQFRHIDCDYAENPDGFGQNIDELLTNYKPDHEDLGYDGDVQDWYDEVEYFPSNLVGGYKDAGNGTYDGGDFGHYTQLVWAKSKKVGCVCCFVIMNQLVTMKTSLCMKRVSQRPIVRMAHQMIIQDCVKMKKLKCVF